MCFCSDIWLNVVWSYKLTFFDIYVFLGNNFKFLKAQKCKTKNFNYVWMRFAQRFDCECNLKLKTYYLLYICLYGKILNF